MGPALQKKHKNNNNNNNSSNNRNNSNNNNNNNNFFIQVVHMSTTWASLNYEVIINKLQNKTRTYSLKKQSQYQKLKF